ncbi:MAG: hypothetical protein ACRCZI_12225 [Cetobacterium sp.]
MAAERELKLKITGDASKAEAAAKKLEKALEAAQKELEALKADAGKADKAVDGLSDEVADLGDTAEKSGGRLSKLGDSIKSKLGDGNDFATKKMEGLSAKLRDDFGPAGDKAAGVVDKLSGKLSSMGPAATVAAGGAAAAVAGIAALGVAAVNTFGELADATTQLQRVMGGSAEETSTLLMAARELGLGYEDLIDVSAEFSANVGDNAAALASYGIEVVKTADGNVDMQATFKNVVERLSEIEDPAVRAKVAITAFGEDGAKKVGPLVAQFEELLKRQKEMQAAKLGLSADDLKSWQEMQRSLRQATGELREMLLVVGKEMVPELAELASNAAFVAGAVNDLTAKVGGLEAIMKISMGPVAAINDGLTGLRGAFGDTEEKVDTFAAAEAALAEQERINTEVMAAEAEAQRVLEESVRRTEQATRDHTSAVNAAIDAENRRNEAVMANVNAHYAYEGALDKTYKATAAVTDAEIKATQATETFGAESVQAQEAQAKLSDTVYSTKGQLIAQAEAAVRLADAQAAASGETLTAEQRSKVYRDELIKLRDSMSSSSLRDAMDSVIIGMGSIGTTSRSAAEQAAALRKELDSMRGIEVNTGIGGGITVRAKGGPVERNTPYLVGEEGPELVVPDAAGDVIPAGETRRLFAAARPTGSGQRPSSVAAAGASDLGNGMVMAIVGRERDVMEYFHRGLRRLEMSGR